MKIALLDRDGVINIDRGYIGDIKNVELLCTKKTAVFLNDFFDEIYIFTNQSGIGRGFFDMQTALKVTRYAAAQCGLTLKGIKICHHHPNDHCNCRKPAPGLVHEIFAEIGNQNVWSIAVGDKWSDLLAAYDKADCLFHVESGVDQSPAPSRILSHSSFNQLKDINALPRFLENSLG